MARWRTTPVFCMQTTDCINRENTHKHTDTINGLAWIRAGLCSIRHVHEELQRFTLKYVKFPEGKEIYAGIKGTTEATYKLHVNILLKKFNSRN